MPTGINEVQTAVNAVVFDVASVEARLIPQVLVILLIDEVNDWLPAEGRGGGEGVKERGWGKATPFLPLPVVHRIPKARAVHHCQPKLHSFLLYVHRGGIDAHGLLDALCCHMCGATLTRWEKKCTKKC